MDIAGLIILEIGTEFGVILRSNTLKVVGVDLFGIGQTNEEDASCRTIEAETDGRYAGFVFRDNHLVGAMLLGDTQLSARLKKAIENRENFSESVRKRSNAEHLIEYLHTHS